MLILCHDRLFQQWQLFFCYSQLSQRKTQQHLLKLVALWTLCISIAVKCIWLGKYSWPFNLFSSSFLHLLSMTFAQIRGIACGSYASQWPVNQSKHGFLLIQFIFTPYGIYYWSSRPRHLLLKHGHQFMQTDLCSGPELLNAYKIL